MECGRVGKCEKWLHVVKSGVRPIAASNEAAFLASLVAAVTRGSERVSEPKGFSANIHRFNTERVDLEDRIPTMGFPETLQILGEAGTEGAAQADAEGEETDEERAA